VSSSTRSATPSAVTISRDAGRILNEPEEGLMVDPRRGASPRREGAERRPPEETLPEDEDVGLAAVTMKSELPNGQRSACLDPSALRVEHLHVRDLLSSDSAGNKALAREGAPEHSRAPPRPHSANEGGDEVVGAVRLDAVTRQAQGRSERDAVTFERTATARR
jgi:hypothetical protein